MPASSAKSESPPGGMRRWHGVAAILLVTVAAYLPALRAGFIWDDDHWVVPPVVRDAGGLARIWLEPGATVQYYPLLFTVFWLEYRVWGIDQPWGYHLVNVLLHAVDAVLLWLVLERLEFLGPQRRCRAAAWVAAAVFALHPVAVESVAWITERKNTLSTAFYLLSLLVWLRVAAPNAHAAPSRSWRAYTLALVLFVAAVLTKTATVVLPAALVVLHWWKQRPLGRELVRLAPWFAFGLAMGLVTVWLEKTEVRAVGDDWDLSLLQRILLAGRIPWFYAAKLIAPMRLTFIYPRWTIDSSVLWQWLFPLATAAVITVLWALRRRLGRGPVVGVLLFLIMLMPALGFFDVYAFRFSWVADHFQYLACTSLIALGVGLAASGTARLPRNARPWTICAVVGLVVTLGLLTWTRATVYRDYESLWLDTLERNPAAWIAHNNLGGLWGGRGDVARAAEAFAMAVRLKPDDALLRANLGRTLSLLERFEEAESELRRALELDPRLALAHVNHAEHLLRTGRTEAGIAAYERALGLQPSAAWHGKFAHILAQAGRPGQAEEHYRAALVLDPQRAEAQFGLARLFHAAGRLDEAQARYQQAVALDPQLFEAHYNLAVIAVARHDLQGALVGFSAAARLRPDHFEARFNHARALVDFGRDDEAIAELEAAIGLAPHHAGAQRLLGKVLLRRGRPAGGMAP